MFRSSEGFKQPNMFKLHWLRMQKRFQAPKGFSKTSKFQCVFFCFFCSSEKCKTQNCWNCIGFICKTGLEHQRNSPKWEYFISLNYVFAHQQRTQNQKCWNCIGLMCKHGLKHQRNSPKRQYVNGSSHDFAHQQNTKKTKMSKLHWSHVHKRFQAPKEFSKLSTFHWF